MTIRTGLNGCLYALLILSSGCSAVSQTALSPNPPDDPSACYAIFPAVPWESVHRIEATIRGASSSLLGVTKGEPSERRVQSLLLTPEGFILFDADRRENQVSVRKSVAPFDSPAFAGGLMEDVNLLFLSPQGDPTTSTKTADGTTICTWKRADGAHLEVAGSIRGGWRILLRDKKRDVKKEVILEPPFLNGLASRMELRASRPASYTLKMTLIETSP